MHAGREKMARGYNNFDIYFTVICQAVNQNCLNRLEKVSTWEGNSISLVGNLCMKSPGEAINLFKARNA